MSHFGDFEHHLQDPSSICWKLYPQYLGDVQLGHLPTPETDSLLVIHGFSTCQSLEVMMMVYCLIILGNQWLMTIVVGKWSWLSISRLTIIICLDAVLADGQV